MAKYFEEVAATVTLETAKDLENTLNLQRQIPMYPLTAKKRRSLALKMNRCCISMELVSLYLMTDARMFQKRTLRRRLLKEDFS